MSTVVWNINTKMKRTLAHQTISLITLTSGLIFSSMARRILLRRLNSTLIILFAVRSVSTIDAISPLIAIRTPLRNKVIVILVFIITMTRILAQDRYPMILPYIRRLMKGLLMSLMNTLIKMIHIPKRIPLVTIQKRK